MVPAAKLIANVCYRDRAACCGSGVIEACREQSKNVKR
jgi:hypothetical protein